MRRILLAALFLFSPGAFAQTFGYTSLELYYVDAQSDFDGVELDGDGYSLTGLLELTDHLALSAEYEDLDFDSGVETRSWSAGVNFHTPILPRTDLVLGAHYLDEEVTQPAGVEDDTGTRLRARLRHKLAPAVELTVDAARTDIFDATDMSSALSLGFGRDTQFIVGYETDDESDALIAGAQFGF